MKEIRELCKCGLQKLQFAHRNSWFCLSGLIAFILWKAGDKTIILIAIYNEPNLHKKQGVFVHLAPG